MFLPTKLTKASISNRQILDASQFRSDYLPNIINKCGHLLSDKILIVLKYQVDKGE